VAADPEPLGAGPLPVALDVDVPRARGAAGALVPDRRRLLRRVARGPVAGDPHVLAAAPLPVAVDPEVVDARRGALGPALGGGRRRRLGGGGRIGRGGDGDAGGGRDARLGAGRGRGGGDGDAGSGRRALVTGVLLVGTARGRGERPDHQRDGEKLLSIKV